MASGAYKELKEIMERNGGSMTWHKATKGIVLGFWELKLGRIRLIFEADPSMKGQSFPELDQLYVPKLETAHKPFGERTYHDDTNTLLPGAEKRLLGYFNFMR